MHPEDAEAAPYDAQSGYRDPRLLLVVLERLRSVRRHSDMHRHDETGRRACSTIEGLHSPLLEAAHRLHAPDGSEAPVDPTLREIVKRIAHVADRPDLHRIHHPTLDQINACCTVNGDFVWILLVAHGHYANLGFNACTDPCDVYEGRCACGASHDWGDPR